MDRIPAGKKGGSQIEDVARGISDPSSILGFSQYKKKLTSSIDDLRAEGQTSMRHTVSTVDGDVLSRVVAPKVVSDCYHFVDGLLSWQGFGNQLHNQLLRIPQPVQDILNILSGELYGEIHVIGCGT